LILIPDKNSCHKLFERISVSDFINAEKLKFASYGVEGYYCPTNNPPEPPNPKISPSKFETMMDKEVKRRLAVPSCSSYS
jgi:hypothetical protein